MGLPKAIYGNLDPNGARGPSARARHRRVTSRCDRVRREIRAPAETPYGALGRALPGTARRRGLALLRLHPGLAGLACLREEFRRGRRRADRVLPRGQRAHGDTLPVPYFVSDRPWIQGPRTARRRGTILRIVRDAPSDP